MLFAAEGETGWKFDPEYRNRLLKKEKKKENGCRAPALGSTRLSFMADK